MIVCPVCAPIECPTPSQACRVPPPSKPPFEVQVVAKNKSSGDLRILLTCGGCDQVYQTDVSEAVHRAKIRELALVHEHATEKGIVDELLCSSCSYRTSVLRTKTTVHSCPSCKYTWKTTQAVQGGNPDLPSPADADSATVYRNLRGA